MNFYKHHIGDYDADTAHLTWLEDMAYTRLMRLYYRRELPVPADIGQACRLVRATSKQEREAVENVLKEFFILEEDGWHNKRCDEEIHAAQVKADKNREVGKMGGRPRKKETVVVPENNHDGFPGKPFDNPSQTPDARNQTPDLNTGRTSGNVDSAGEGSGEGQPAAVRFAVAVRNWEKARGKVIALTPQDPRVIAWEKAGVTDAQLRLAYEMAVDARTTEGDTTPVNAGFLDVFVAKVLKPVTGTSAVPAAAKKAKPAPWYATISVAVIDEKAKEVGLSHEPGEQFMAFRQRVLHAHGVTEDMISKAKGEELV